MLASESWNCVHCTYVNSNDIVDCSMCALPKTINQSTDTDTNEPQEIRDPIPSFTDQLINNPSYSPGYQTGSFIDQTTSLNNLENKLEKDIEQAKEISKEQEDQRVFEKWKRTYPLDKNILKFKPKPKPKILEKSPTPERSPTPEPELSEQNKILQQLAQEREQRQKQKN